MKNLKNPSKNTSCKISVDPNHKYSKTEFEHQSLLNLLNFINTEENKRHSNPTKISNHALVNLLNEILEVIKRNYADVSIKKI